MPKIDVAFVTGEELLALLQTAMNSNCRDRSAQPLITLLDLRTENHLKPESATSTAIAHIKTFCPKVFSLLDQLQLPEVRDKIPKTGLVVTVTETGNRDKFAIQYLSKFGYKNLKGLLFGMRGWIKQGYPVETLPLQVKP